MPTALAAHDVLRAETEALRLAQQALRDRQPEQALRLLEEQDLRFRDGLLRQERAAARVLALCQTGKADEARAQALRFERLWPRSALLARLRAACWAR
jgi:outer membrane protein assembly factor BamD (BamD/ComL family)